MGRKGMKGFLKSGQKAANDGSDDDTEVAVAVSSKAAAGEQAHLQAPAVASTSARDAGSGSDSDEDSNGPETRGKMLQRHKRVSWPRPWPWAGDHAGYCK